VIGSVAGRHETARLEAFSDGVIAIAITILALELRVPNLEEITSAKLVAAILNEWPSYFAFVLSFTTILIMWINHHARLALVERVDGLLMFGNGLLMMTIVALSYPTALVGEYLRTPAGKTAVATYGLFVLGTSAAWNIFMLALRPGARVAEAGRAPRTDRLHPSPRGVRPRDLPRGHRARARECLPRPLHHHGDVGVLGGDRLPGAQPTRTIFGRRVERK
jgi:uncharacterized membrane protein